MNSVVVKPLPSEAFMIISKYMASSLKKGILLVSTLRPESMKKNRIVAATQRGEGSSSFQLGELGLFVCMTGTAAGVCFVKSQQLYQVTIHFFERCV